MAKAIALFLCVLLWGVPVEAQKTTRIGEPSSVGVAMAGIVLTGVGFGMMLHQKPCYYRPDQTVCGGSDPGWLVGGMMVVGAGVFVVYLGLRPKTVIIAPAVSRTSMGVQGRVVWGH
jgi:hypothetical protein